MCWGPLLTRRVRFTKQPYHSVPSLLSGLADNNILLTQRLYRRRHTFSAITTFVPHTFSRKTNFEINSCFGLVADAVRRQFLFGPYHICFETPTAVVTATLTFAVVSSFPTLFFTTVFPGVFRVYLVRRAVYVENSKWCYNIRAQVTNLFASDTIILAPILLYFFFPAVDPPVTLLRGVDSHESKPTIVSIKFI